MTIPWLERLPTPAEVAAHAKAFPAKGFVKAGLWLREDPDYTMFRVLETDGARIFGPDAVGLHPRSHKEARWLPCAAEGIPVCLLPKEGA